MKKIKKMLNKEDGFTLIETTIVLLVIALLTILILPNVSGVTDNVNDSTSTAIIQTVETQQMLYESNNPTEITVELVSALGEVIDSETITITSKAGLFDIIAGFFRSLFGKTQILPF